MENFADIATPENLRTLSQVIGLAIAVGLVVTTEGYNKIASALLVAVCGGALMVSLLRML